MFGADNKPSEVIGTTNEVLVYQKRKGSMMFENEGHDLEIEEDDVVGVDRDDKEYMKSFLGSDNDMLLEDIRENDAENPNENPAEEVKLVKIVLGHEFQHVDAAYCGDSFRWTPQDIGTKECPAAFVFFKTRYAAVVASEILQSSNPMSWVTDLAPEPHDVYWSNLCIRYQQLWIRRIGTLLAAIAFMFVFLFPVTLVQGLTKLDKLQQQRSPFLKEILRNKFMNRVVTGYLPSVILLIFLYAVPPTMMLFSAVEGSFSRSGRKKSACCKVLGFTIWNIFFVNVLSGEVIERLNYISNSIPKDIPATIARAIPEQATFFMTYVLTSGWTSLSFEIMQVFSLLSNLFSRYILKRKDETSGSTLSFPYHTEIPKLLVFGLLGFTCSVMAPLILPLLLVYFFLAYLVYRNQFLNVYVSKYESGGQFWPIAHNTTIFSLVLSQVIGMGVFGIKRSPMASGFIIPLIILTLLFNEYCRKRFNPIFEKVAAEVMPDILIQMDRRDEQNGKMGEIHRQLESAYCQFTICSKETSKGPSQDHVEDMHAIQDTEDMMPGFVFALDLGHVLSMNLEN
ncbi:CSC1/OSCA1-like, 7TM region [Dillenia turbinata]|uniref:CSC1/OSCA1-like, 7TM region n=1 Tax=Dillenia turbinata TaxID=194707 RepID=A0AAN8VUB8_9MAGN